MAVFKNTSGQWVASYNGQKTYHSSQAAAGRAYEQMKAGSSTVKTSGGTATKTSAGYETVQQTVDRAKALLGTAYDPTTTAKEPVQQTVDRAKAMVAQTQAQGSTPFAGSTFEQQYLAKYPAPTNVADIQQTDALQIPTLPTPLGDISSAVGGVSGIQAMLDANKKFYEEQMRLQLEQQNKQKSLFEKMLGSVQSPGEARTQAWDETGIDVQQHFAEQERGIKEVEALTNEYNKIVEAKDLQIAQTQDKMASMNFINNQTAQIERNAAPQLNRISAQINAKAAMLEAQQGNFAQAQSYVNQAVQDAVADYKFKADMYSEMYKINQDGFDRMTSLYSDAFKTSMNIAQAEYERQYDEKMRIGELMLKYPNAGIDLYSDGYAGAIKKASAVAGTNGAPDLTADQKNYVFAVDQGYKGTFAEWLGKNGSVDGVEGLAMSLYLGQIGIGDVPSEDRNAVLELYNKMKQAELEESLTPKETTISAPTGTETTGTKSDWTLTGIWNSLTDKLFGD